MADLAVNRSQEADQEAPPPRKKRKLKCVSLTPTNKKKVTEEISKQPSLQQKYSWKRLDWKLAVDALQKVVTVPPNNSSRLWEPEELTPVVL